MSDTSGAESFEVIWTWPHEWRDFAYRTVRDCGVTI